MAAGADDAAGGDGGGNGGDEGGDGGKRAVRPGEKINPWCPGGVCSACSSGWGRCRGGCKFNPFSPNFDPNAHLRPYELKVELTTPTRMRYLAARHLAGM